MNSFVLRHIKVIELVAVIIRIVSFGTVSWLGPKSPFFWVWMLNTLDAIALSWCAVLRRDPAYILLNIFWVLVGLVGILKSL